MSPDVRITADRRSYAAGTAAFKPVANVWRMAIRAIGTSPKEAILCAGQGSALLFGQISIAIRYRKLGK
jgi:hypothetical protein